MYLHFYFNNKYGYDFIIDIYEISKPGDRKNLKKEIFNLFVIKFPLSSWIKLTIKIFKKILILSIITLSISVDDDQTNP